MVPWLSGPAASLTIMVCLLVILMVAAPGAAAPWRSPAAGAIGPGDETPTATPATAIYLPWIASDFVALPPATPTETPTATPTLTPTPTMTPSPTPTLPPACPLPAQIDPAIAISVTPNRNTALDQIVGKVPFTINMTAAATDGAPPYSFCWDIEPDGHQDALGANPTFTLSRAGIFNPLVVVTDAQGHGQYVGIPPAGSSSRPGGKP